MPPAKPYNIFVPLTIHIDQTRHAYDGMMDMIYTIVNNTKLLLQLLLQPLPSYINK